MTIEDQKNISIKIIEVVEIYLGPAAERFVKRQSELHFDKPAEELNKDDIEEMANTVSTAMGLLTHDKKLVKESQAKIMELKN